MASDDRAPAVRTREKLDEDDHDLLNFGEAGQRLRLEIAFGERHERRLDQSSSGNNLSKAPTLLKALGIAAQRIRRIGSPTRTPRNSSATQAKPSATYPAEANN
ncbi:hypothetical protein [Mycobacterium paraseoulense]|uniref:hypothetical protein n=1 Tax=Mycobacterium paraseoulense TaxID=590652 RepID=UPI00138CB34F|nr:hypothetical protein [Mycobacterium paraseoulense]BBZ70702.1 hypothetical protein MPRS_17950 [Mycobacterium paraseoulense]